MNTKASSPKAQKTESPWRGLYIAGGVAALIVVVLFRRNLGAELTLLGSFDILDVPETPPISALDWFTLLQQNTIVGLILFGVSESA